jgi:HPt (histidine-containing phosphotransfer) domain-containing protein
MEHKDDEAVAHAPQDEEPVFDRQVLAEMLGDDVAAQRELLADYRAAAGQLRGALDAAYAAHDGEALARIAHKLKSSSRAVGAMQLGAASATLERAGREGDWAGIAAAYDTLRAADARLTAVLGS